MPRRVTVGLIQSAAPVSDPAVPIEQVKEAAIAAHLPLIEEAGRRGVQMLGLQEIFNGPYFCPSQDAHWYDMAEPVPGPTTERMAEYAAQVPDGHGRPGLRARAAGRLLQHRRRLRRRRPLPGQVPQEPHPAHGRLLGEVLLQAGESRLPGLRDPLRAGRRLYLLRPAFPRGGAPARSCTAPRSSSTRRRRSRASRNTCGSSSSRRTRSPTATSWRAATGWAPRRHGTSAASTARPTSSIRAGTSWPRAREDKDELITATLDLDQIEEVRRVWQFYRDRRPETYAAMAEL